MQGPIYEPKERAKEYSLLALNHYVGCSHGCGYCYVPNILRYKEFYNRQYVKPNVLENLRKQAPRFSGIDKRVLLCFACDPYQPLDIFERTTRAVIEILKKHDIPFQVLTKGGMYAVRDFYLYDSKDAFAVTLTFLDEANSRKIEPNAERPELRINTLQIAHDLKIETWVSLEPVIEPKVSLEIIRRTHEFVDLYKIGKMNYCPTPVSGDEWHLFAIEAIRLCEELDKPYFIKSDLAKHIPDVKFTNTDNRRAGWPRINTNESK